MKKQSKLWIAGYLILVIAALSFVGQRVVSVDPFFHYHKPNTSEYFYILNNQRSQNDGISKNFDYDALITGTSMTENFKTTEMDDIFGTKSVKVSYSGGSYKEINDNLINALRNNPDLKIIVRGLDMSYYLEDKDLMRDNLGKYPTYLYDNNVLNDVQYIYNRDVVFQRVVPMIFATDNDDFEPGITSFDTYSNWMASYTFGREAVCSYTIAAPEKETTVHLSEREKDIVLGTVRQNITSLAKEYPNVTFYYFFTPYSIVWWRDLVNSGIVYKQIEAEQIIIEEILKCENIKLYSFNNLTNIITDLNNYKDTQHYGSWINSLILHYMKDGKCLLTYDNYEAYLAQELEFYTTYDYASLNSQIDYENDYYAEALLNYDINGVQPVDVLETFGEFAELNGAKLIQDEYNGRQGIECKGRLQRDTSMDETSLADYIINTEYVGAKIEIDDISDYKYLVFYGIKHQDHGQPMVCIYDKNNTVLAEFSLYYSNIDNQLHQYMIDVSKLSGPVTIIFNGGYVDNSGSTESLYTFNDIILY